MASSLSNIQFGPKSSNQHEHFRQNSIKTADDIALFFK